jgi:hypothetical protein
MPSEIRKKESAARRLHIERVMITQESGGPETAHEEYNRQIRDDEEELNGKICDPRSIKSMTDGRFMSTLPRLPG